MNRISNALGLSQIENRRKKQLDRQHRLDQELRTVSHQCPEEVISYIFLLREYSRQQQIRLIESPLREKKQTMNIELDQNDHNYDMLEEALSMDNFCQSLPYLMMTVRVEKASND